MKKLKGKITISRPTSSHAEPYVSITVIDELAGREAVSVEIELANFAEALTGLSRVPCKLEWNDSGVIGKIRETKTEPVFIPGKVYASNRDEIARNALANHETDGWTGSVSDATNHHRRIDRRSPEGLDGAWQSVHFERWVDAPEDPTS